MSGGIPRPGPPVPGPGSAVRPATPQGCAQTHSAGRGQGGAGPLCSKRGSLLDLWRCAPVFKAPKPTGPNTAASRACPNRVAWRPGQARAARLGRAHSKSSTTTRPAGLPSTVKSKYTCTVQWVLSYSVLSRSLDPLLPYGGEGWASCCRCCC